VKVVEMQSRGSPDRLARLRRYEKLSASIALMEAMQEEEVHKEEERQRNLARVRWNHRRLVHELLEYYV